MLRNRYMGLVPPRQWTWFDDYLLWRSPGVRVLEFLGILNLQPLRDKQRAEEEVSQCQE